MKFGPLLTSARGWWQRTRCQWLLIMALLCLGLRENYPFSHFPMYSSFAHRTYLIYLSDRQGEPVRTKEFGLSSSTLKKIFDRGRRRELMRFKDRGSARVPLAEEAAAQSLLRYLEGLVRRKPEAAPLLPGLQVHHAYLHQEAGEIRLETHLLAQHR